MRHGKISIRDRVRQALEKPQTRDMVEELRALVAAFESEKQCPECGTSLGPKLLIRFNYRGEKRLCEPLYVKDTAAGQLLVCAQIEPEIGFRQFCLDGAFRAGGFAFVATL